MPELRRYEVKYYDDRSAECWWSTTAYDAADALTQYGIYRTLHLGYIDGKMQPMYSDAREVRPQKV